MNKLSFFYLSETKEAKKRREVCRQSYLKKNLSCGVCKIISRGHPKRTTRNWTAEETNFSSSHQRCSIKDGVLRTFVEFTGKSLCQNLFFNKVAGLWPATL